MSTLIGKKANQVPTNGMLGSMAYADVKELDAINTAVAGKLSATGTAVAALIANTVQMADKRTLKPTEIAGGTAQAAFVTKEGILTGVAGNQYGDFIALKGYHDASAELMNGLFFDKRASVQEIVHFRAALSDPLWSSGKTLAYKDSDITGNAATATKWAFARLLGGVSVDGTTNVNLPGVNVAGNQNTTGNAATATLAATPRFSSYLTGSLADYNGAPQGGVSFDYTSTAPNGPWAGEATVITVATNANRPSVQLSFRSTDSAMAVRTSYGTTTYPWKTVAYTDSNITGSAATLSTVDKRGAISPGAVVPRTTVTAFVDYGDLTTGTNSGIYGDFLAINGWGTSTAGGKMNGLYFAKGGQAIVHMQAVAADATWGTPKTLAYTDSSITGNSATATKLSTTRAFTINGVAKNFDGSAPVTWTPTEVTNPNPVLSSVNSGQLAGLRNRLINGDERVNQRGFNGTWTGLAEGAYGYDRWKRVGANKVQIIEATEFRAGVVHTLSGTGLTTSQITSPASGNWSISVPHAATNIQLEEGTVATPFEKISYALQLTLCQRFYETVFAHIVSGAPTVGMYGGARAYFKVNKRTPTPTITALAISVSNNISNIGTSYPGQDGFTVFGQAAAVSNVMEYAATYSINAEL